MNCPSGNDYKALRYALTFPPDTCHPAPQAKNLAAHHMGPIGSKYQSAESLMSDVFDSFGESSPAGSGSGKQAAVSLFRQPANKNPPGCPGGFYYFFFPFLSVFSFFRFWRMFLPLCPRALCSFFLVGLYMPGVTTFFFGLPCLTRRTFPFSS